MKNPDLLLEKGLPAALEAEQAVIGAALKEYAFANIAGMLRPEDFSLQKHRRIFQVMADLDAQGETVNHATVGTELMRRGQLEAVDGLSYLLSLDEALPTIANTDAYVSIVHEKSIQR